MDQLIIFVKGLSFILPIKINIVHSLDNNCFRRIIFYVAICSVYHPNLYDLVKVMCFTVGIYLYDEVEILDFCGPYEVFTTAARVGKRLFPNDSPMFNVVTLASPIHSVHCRGGLNVEPDFDIRHHPALDMLIVPGGVADKELEKQDVMDWLHEMAHSVSICASVCTGAFMLAKAGLLNGRYATTHWEDIGDLEKMFPQIKIKRNVRWIDEGNLVTSAGISAGIDMSLYLVSRLVNQDLALRTARQMEYDWNCER